jgi:hypothetical protein
MSTQNEILFYKSQVEADKDFLGFFHSALTGLPTSLCPLTRERFGEEAVRTDSGWILITLLDRAGVPRHRVLPILYRFLRRVADEDIRDSIWAAIDVWEYYANQGRYHKIDREVNNMNLNYDLAWTRNYLAYRPGTPEQGYRDSIETLQRGSMPPQV